MFPSSLFFTPLSSLKDQPFASFDSPCSCCSERERESGWFCLSLYSYYDDKYMASGMPIPPDLIFPIKRSLESSVSSRLFPHQPMDWGCFQMGFGRNIYPEPGRCRRTDGKKWRCSKEAYPNSKYCERHMHNGRNRSRKPVEVNKTPTNPISSFANNILPSSTITTTTNPSSYSISSSLTSDKHHQEQHHHPYHNAPLRTFLYPHQTSSSSPRPQSIGYSPQSNTLTIFSLTLIFPLP